ncbi:hypothetical protein U8335_04455 [Roseiconus lacunae]|nr:hypothetical protein U8335_04455 [Stieleria sp. HD01]
MCHHSFSRVALVLAIIVASVTSDLVAADDNKRSTEPLNQIYDRLTQIHSDLDTIRVYMGRSQHSAAMLNVRDVRARQIYFQSLVLYRISQRFAFDHTRLRADPIGQSAIGYAPILDLANAAHDRLRSVMTLYGMPSQNVVASRQKVVTEVLVFESVVLAIHKLNGLLDERISPSDVFEQVTVGIGYTSRILEQTQPGQVMPETPDFIPDRLPADVYRRLLNCLAITQRIGQQSGLPILELDTKEADVQDVEPGDVLNLASLVVSEIAYIHSLVPNTAPPREVYAVGRKFPAHVYQRVGILERQLERLQSHAQLNPQWLGPASVNDSE